MYIINKFVSVFVNLKFKFCIFFCVCCCKVIKKPGYYARPAHTSVPLSPMRSEKIIGIKNVAQKFLKRDKRFK